MRIVFIDLETGGLDPNKHPVTQIAAIAVDEQLNELASFERKLDFNVGECEAEALAKSSYDHAVWVREAIPSPHVCQELSAFLKRHADVEMISQRTGKPYSVAQVVGYNAQTFDGPFLQALFRKHDLFLPGSYRVMDIMQRVLWEVHERPRLATKPVDFKLETICKYYGITIDGAHDAMVDVRATLQLYRAILEG